MNVLNSKPQINLKNHISNKNKGESIRYCPKITVPNTLALSVGGGNVTLCELFGQFASRRLRVHDKVEVGLGVRTP